MDSYIKTAIANTQEQNRFVNKTEVEAIFNLVKQAEARTEAAVYLDKNAQLLIDAATQSVYLKFPGYTSTLESKAQCADTIGYILRLIQYCLVANGTELMDEYLISGLEHIKPDLNLNYRCIIEGLNYIKANHSLTDQEDISVSSYIDYAAKLVNTIAEDKNTVNDISNGKVKEAKAYDYTIPPIWEQLLKLGAEVPPSEWVKFPRDFARNLEHYMYGTPKEE